jgi:cyclophilin family peptidyl-prolyl cis-trans isomerase|tara:strand:+ start:159 stop:812 length:654 start_codon:yes stop_codon:yes gene_type:complete
MLKKIKQTKSEKLLLIFLILLAIFSLISFTLIKNKCLFVEKVNLTKLNFNKPENIVILNVPCGNVVIELFPSISPNSVERFKKLVKNKEYDNVAFHRVVENFLVQAGDLEFGRKENINYTYIGSGRSKYDLIKPETDKPFEFKRGTVAFAKSKNGDAEDSEFLILLADAFLFEGEYTPLGRVINGISALEKIKFNDQSEYVLRPDFINSLKMFSDIN